MLDYQQARETMLDSQIRTCDVTDYHIQSAFRHTPRECFVPKSKMALAYSDSNIEVDDGRVMMRPRDLAKMIAEADIAPTDIVLNIACGRGYSVAVQARLAETVVALEETEERANKATALLDKCEITNTAVVVGPLRAGAPEHGPYNVIFVNGAVSCIPDAWFDQLADGGRLVVPVLDGPLSPVRVYTKKGDRVSDRYAFDATMPLIPGFEPKDGFDF